jgi:hypothetical protein
MSAAEGNATPVAATEQTRQTAQPASTEHAQARRFACCLNLRLPHHFEPLPGPPRTIFFSLTPLFVKERLLVPLLAARLTMGFCHHRKSIIAHISHEQMSSARSADCISRKDRFVTLSSSALRLIISKR